MKDKIIKHFVDENKDIALNLYEKYLLAQNRDIPVFGNAFYTPNIWKWFEANLGSKNLKVESNGIFKDSERRMISFNNIYNTEFPMKLLKVQNTSKLLKLSHSDYLGGILSLGIERSKIGDLLVQENCCYVPIHEELEDFMVYNIDKIGKVSCKVEILENYELLPEYNLEEEIIIVSSLRLDAIVSKLCKTSRGKAQVLIEQGQVLLDYVRTRDKSHELKGDERITIRGTGKFILGDKVGNSKSGKIKITIKKYT